VEKLELVNVRADLHQYLRDRYTLISPEFSEVVADALRFVEAVIRRGFKTALVELTPQVRVQHCRPFIEVAEVVVGYHLRFVSQADHEMVRKSLLEAYTHIAGPAHIFKPAKKTRFVYTLRRSDSRKFAALLLSLHLYNLICAEIESEMRRRIPNAKALELYMLNVEAICRDTVTNTVKAEAVAFDQEWAMTVIKRIEAQMLPRELHQVGRSISPNRSNTGNDRK